MPAGALVVADFQLELRLLLMGAGTEYEIGPGAITGLGQTPVKSADVELDHADGSYGSPDYSGARTLTIPLLVHGDDPADCMDNFSTLLAAWVPSTSDIPLYIQLPGWGKFYVNGRPRGLDDDMSRLKSSEIAALATFVALNPAIT